MHTPRRQFVRQGLPITSKIAASGRETPSALSCTIIGARLSYQGSHLGSTGPLAASSGSSLGREATRGAAALLLLAAALSPPTAAAQRTPQPIFTELFTYDPAVPSQLLGKWLISSQLNSKSQPLRVGVVEDSIGKTVGRVTVHEGDGLAGANEAMLQARHFICHSEDSRAAAVEAEAGGVVPSERAEIQVRSDRATGAGELVKFGELVWYRFSFKIAGDWPHDVPVVGRQLCRTVIHQIKQDSLKDGKSCDASPFFKIEARPLGERVRFFAQVATGTPCARPPMVMRVKICRRDLPREIWTTVQVRLNPAHDASGRVDIWLNGSFCGTYHGPVADRDYGVRRDGAPSSTHSRGSAFIVTGARRPTRSMYKIMFWNADPSGHPDWGVSPLPG
jgi:Polysaccharide lyase